MGMPLVETSNWTIHSPRERSTIENRNEREGRLYCRPYVSRIPWKEQGCCVATERWRDIWSDAEESISILIALARPRADKCWHQLLLWFVNRLREKPLEVSHGARLLL